MNPKSILVILLFLALLLETTIISFPLFLFVAVVYFVLYPKTQTLFVLLAGSLVLDSLTSGRFGSTSLFMFAVLLFLSIYQGVLDIKNYKILLIAIFIFSLIYAYVFSYTLNFFVYLLIYGTIFTALFVGFKKKLIY